MVWFHIWTRISAFTVKDESKWNSKQFIVNLTSESSTNFKYVYSLRFLWKELIKIFHSKYGVRVKHLPWWNFIYNILIKRQSIICYFITNITVKKRSFTEVPSFDSIRICWSWPWFKPWRVPLSLTITLNTGGWKFGL